MQPSEAHVDALEKFRRLHPHMGRKKAWPLFQAEHLALLATKKLNLTGFRAAMDTIEERIAMDISDSDTKQEDEAPKPTRHRRNSGAMSHDDSKKGQKGRKRD